VKQRLAQIIKKNEHISSVRTLLSSTETSGETMP